MARSFEMDLTKGSILKQIITYSLPIMGINLVQLLFNAADIAILGRFSSDAAVGAVGSTTALINLIIGFFIGMTVSANVLIARYKGAGDQERSDKCIGTSIVISLIFGLVCTVVGLFFSETFLIWTGCKTSFLSMATKYMQIYFLGVPLVLLYHFTSSVMRAVGDTMSPFIFLVIGGVLNIFLNIFLIFILRKDVEAVAIATVSSQAVSAILCIIVLAKGKGFARINFKLLKIDKHELVEILKIGIPTGIQRSVFSLSNVVLRSTLNTFPENVVTANTIAYQFSAIVHDVTASFAVATTAFVSQNLGAKNFKRIRKVITTSLGVVIVIALASGGIIYGFGRPLCGIMTTSKDVIEIAMTRLAIMCPMYFLTGMGNVFSGTLRSFGKPTLAMLASFFCTVVLRIAWIKLIFPLNPTLEMFYWVYPLSWAIDAILLGIFTSIVVKKRFKQEREKQAQEEQEEELQELEQKAV